MQETRQRILEIIKLHGQSTVDELSHELGLTAVTIRHHLEILRSKGLVAPPKALRKGGPGRPQHVYRLADEADELFPKSYDRLAGAVLAELSERLSPNEMEGLLDQVARRLVDEAKLPPDQSPAERLNSTLEFLNKVGYLASLEPGPESRMGIRIANCPYGRVARNHPEVCEVGRRMIAQLVGVDHAQVERITEESGRCLYLFPFG